MAPIEWLNELVERPDGYRAVLVEAGSVGAAAWRIARARCQVHAISTSVPTALELRAAAKELGQHLGLVQLPAGPILAGECEALGLPVM